jgi:hypothetical protein
VFLNLRGFRPRIPEEFWTTSDRARVGTLVFATFGELGVAETFPPGRRSDSDRRSRRDSTGVPMGTLLLDDVSNRDSRIRFIETIPMDVLRPPNIEPDL